MHSRQPRLWHSSIVSPSQIPHTCRCSLQVNAAPSIKLVVPHPWALPLWPVPAATRATHVIDRLAYCFQVSTAGGRDAPISPCWRQPGISQEPGDGRNTEGRENGQIACTRIAMLLAGLSISCRKPLFQDHRDAGDRIGGGGTARNFGSLLANDYSIRNLPIYLPGHLLWPSHMRASPSLFSVT